ncbi:LysR family transcriptional regulator [Bordetella sp. H567]|uniref:LysR family transcriptional regulator n=1 Tax=Bordetella sp. H567 TaxID=1697043 RepID=UPI00082DAFD6|nr:LysR family transcriptional regulator [Bordetella sp. H567]
MELRHLRYFVAVAEELHFGRAARRLNISQPPLSQQIRALEQDAGVELFRRDTRRVQLTPAGAELLKYARSALSHVDQGVRSARRVHQGEVGRLNVGFITSLSYTYLPWLVRAFRKRYPAVELVLTEKETWDQKEALLDGRLDVGLMRGPFEASGLRTSSLLQEPFVAALPDTHPLARLPRINLGSLSNDPFILFPRAIGGAYNATMSALFDEADFRPIVAQEAVQMHVVVGLVGAGLGVAVVPASIRLLPTPGVVFKPLVQCTYNAELVIACREDATSPVIAPFSQLAKEIIGKGLTPILRRRQSRRAKRSEDNPTASSAV